jgi:DNA-binding MarR family transcriptional regulator
MDSHTMAGHLIRRLNQHSTQVFAARMQAAGIDLTPVQFAAMDAIASTPGLDQAGVAAAIAYDKATIGGVIDRLEQKGYIARSVSKHDRRSREVRLTAAGQALFKQALPFVAALQDDILPGLTAAERTMFIGLARKVIGSQAGVPVSAGN